MVSFFTTNLVSTDLSILLRKCQTGKKLGLAHEKMQFISN